MKIVLMTEDTIDAGAIESLIAEINEAELVPALIARLVNGGLPCAANLGTKAASVRQQF